MRKQHEASVSGTAGDVGNHTCGRRATAAIAHEKGRMMAAGIDVTSEGRG
jgi:hypothetical protein